MKILIIANNDFANQKLIDKTPLELILSKVNKLEFETILLGSNKDYNLLNLNYKSKPLENAFYDLLDEDILVIKGNAPFINNELITKLIRLHYKHNNDVTYTSCVSFLDSPLFIANRRKLIKYFEDDSTLLQAEQLYYINKDNLLVINNIENKIEATSLLQKSIIEYWSHKDVEFKDIKSVVIGDDVILHHHVTIESNCKILGKSVIYSYSTIEENSYINNSIIKTKSTVISSRILDSIVGENTRVGPYANIHSNSNILNNCRIGNFVEIKNSKLGNNNKVSHLTYLGDLESLDNVNFGCGCISVNYDGKTKHKTIIGSNVFIGCNVNLIAPIKIGDNAFIAAGSTITKDVPTSSLAIARSYQINKENYYN